MEVRHTVLVVSGLVDSTIKEYQPDVEFSIFHTLQELSDYIETTPIRAEVLYITKDIFPTSSVNTNLIFLLNMLDNPFLGVTRVVYITEEDSQEIVNINYILEQQGLDNWTIVKGAVTREYISNIINGTLDDDDVDVKRKAVFRMPREAYYREQREKKKSLDTPYVTDEDYLAGVEVVEPIETPLPEVNTSCVIKHIVGIDCLERTVSAFMCAQYLALSGKTLILERDWDFHTLTEFVTKSGVDCTLILVEDLLRDPIKTVDVIRKCSSSLVVVGAIQRMQYDYMFMVNVLVNNLMSDISYFVEEDLFTDIPDDLEHTIIVPANMIGLLKTTECIDRNYLHSATFVGVELKYLPEIGIKSSDVIVTILRDVLDNPDITCPLISVTSLRLKGDSYDFSRIF